MDSSVARNICLFASFWVLLCLPAAAADSPPPEIRFRHFTIEQGLSQSAVNAVIQDRRGYIWLGTQDGLNRYDGYEFTVYRHNSRDTTSLSDSYITCLLEDSGGDFWVGTYSGGLNVLDRSHGGFRHIVRGPAGEGGLSGNSIMSLAEDHSGNIWAATWPDGVNRYDPRTRTWTHFLHDAANPGSLCDGRVRNLLVDRNGRLWLCTFGGLDCFDSSTQRFSHYRSVPADSPGLHDNRVMCAFEDREGDLWFGSFEAGVAVYDSRQASFVKNITTAKGNNGLSSNRIVEICQGGDGAIWIGTWDAGVNRLDKMSGQIQIDRHTDDDPYCLSGDQIRSMYTDRQGGIWIGTDGGGANHYDPARFKFRHLRHINNNPQSISNPLVRALCEDRNGTLWVGTGGGLDSYDPRTGHFEHYRNSQGKANSLSSDLVMTLVEDRDGKLWVGTDGGGLNLFDRRTRTFKVFRSDPRDPSTIGSDYIMTLCEGRDGTLWIGTTGGGLTSMNRQTHVCQRYRRTRDAPDQISGNYIYAIHEDSDGRIWLGTWGAGITVLDPKTNQVRVYRHDPAQPTSLSNNTIHAFHRGAAGSLWIATMGGGLECYDVVSGGFTHITDQDGLPNNVLYRIEEDSTGRLWISTNCGISCYDSQNRTFRNYGLSDGVQSLEFNQGASCKGPDGTLYFGGINGVNSITPERLATTHHVPPVVITQVKVMDREVKVPGSERDVLELDHDENFLSFMFSVLDFTAPEQNTCRYMLEGLDKGWINAGTRRYAAYTDLQPGEYLLRVQGRSSDGEWNREGSAARIRVRPPFWGTLWFRAMALAAILGMGFGFYRDRMQRLQKERTAQAEFSRKLNEFQENERKRIAGELHDSLGQDLLTIRNRLAVCEAMPLQGDAIQHEIRDIAGSVQQTIEEVREISADLHPHMLERLGLTRTIESTVKKCAASSGITMEATVDNVDHLFAPVEEINVFRIVQEGLNNVVKHSRASECTVTLLKNAATCELVLADDGCGFVPAQPLVAHESNGGFGLMHMAERVRLLHGSMEIASSPGNGTTLRISLPLSHHSPTGTS